MNNPNELDPIIEESGNVGATNVMEDIMEKTKTDDVVVDFETLFPILNRYTEHYNNLNSRSIGMLQGIDRKDKTSTTYQMEDFFKIAMAYNENENDHPEENKIYHKKESTELKSLKNSYEIFELSVVGENSNEIYYSKSLFALLKKVADDDIDYGLWKIVTFE